MLGKNQEVFKQYVNHLKREHAWNGIKKQYPYKDQEIKLAFAFQLYLNDHPGISGVCPKTIRFDCGSKEGLVRAQAYFALNHREFKNIHARLVQTSDLWCQRSDVREQILMTIAILS